MNAELRSLIQNETLTYDQSYHLWSFFHRASIDQQVAILALLRTHKETKALLLGARTYWLEHALSIDCPFDVIDIVGTGGDALGTFNISTAASLLVASCGVYVAKHGGRKVTSQVGSADVLSHLNIKPLCSPEAVLQSLKEHRYAFITASLFNQALKEVSPSRALLNCPTFFNSLAPLLNPLQPKRQVVGVYRKDLMTPMVEALQAMGSQHALVIHSHDGLDEISISAPTYVIELNENQQHEYQIHPADFNLSTAPLQTVLGGGPLENARIIKGILTDLTQGPPQDIVVLNSAAGLLVSGQVKNLNEGVILARDAIQSGRAANFLQNLTGEM